MRSPKLALLISDTPLPPVLAEFGDYAAIYEHWLRESKPVNDVTFQLDPFYVFNESVVYPDAGEYDAIILTASSFSAYESLPWIHRLKKYVADVAAGHPQVRLIGICFGHQIIASALGGECVPNDGDWEIGVTEVLLNPTGKEVFGGDKMAIQQYHRDHVPKLPEGFILLGSTTISPIQGMLLPYPGGMAGNFPSAAETHILTVQGHPEYTGTIVEMMTDVREERGILSAARAAKARVDAHINHDGIGSIGKAIWRVILASEEFKGSA